MKNKTCGIYLITERATRRDVYVGQSIKIEGRWPKHWKKFPQDRFDFRILLQCPPCDLDFWEQHYIRVLKTHWTEGGENQDWGGQHWPKPEEPCSPATRAKISAAKKGRVKGPMSEERKAKISAAKKGRVSPNKGKPPSEETRAKISAANKGKNKGRPPHNKGKPHSEETKAKLKGRAFSEEHRAKLSAAQKGRVRGPMSEEAKAKSSATQKGKPGKPLSEEQKKKISEAVKARLALKRAAAAVAALEALLAPENICLQSEFPPSLFRQPE